MMSKDRRWIKIAIAMVLVVGVIVLLGRCSTGDDDREERAPRDTRTEIQRVAEFCSVHHLVQDSGTSITMISPGQVTIDKIGCVLGALDAPQRIVGHIESTRALDGQQTEAWDSYSARWTYHPDYGLNITIWEK